MATAPGRCAHLQELDHCAPPRPCPAQDRRQAPPQTSARRSSLAACWGSTRVTALAGLQSKCTTKERELQRAESNEGACPWGTQRSCRTTRTWAASWARPSCLTRTRTRAARSRSSRRWCALGACSAMAMWSGLCCITHSVQAVQAGCRRARRRRCSPATTSSSSRAPASARRAGSQTSGRPGRSWFQRLPEQTRMLVLGGRTCCALHALLRRRSRRGAISVARGASRASTAVFRLV